MTAKAIAIMGTERESTLSMYDNEQFAHFSYCHLIVHLFTYKYAVFTRRMCMYMLFNYSILFSGHYHFGDTARNLLLASLFVEN